MLAGISGIPLDLQRSDITHIHGLDDHISSYFEIGEEYIPLKLTFPLAGL